MGYDTGINRFSWRRKSVGILFLALIAVGWYFAGDSINDTVDRYLVRSFEYKEGRTKLTDGFRGGDFRVLYLHDGKCVKVGEGVFCYARSMSHHTLFGFRAGYGYVNVNGRVFWRGRGECGNTLHVDLENESVSSGEQISETSLIEALRKQGFAELP